MEYEITSGPVVIDTVDVVLRGDNVIIYSIDFSSKYATYGGGLIDGTSLSVAFKASPRTLGTVPSGNTWTCFTIHIDNSKWEWSVLADVARYTGTVVAWRPETKKP